MFVNSLAACLLLASASQAHVVRAAGEKILADATEGSPPPTKDGIKPIDQVVGAFARLGVAIPPNMSTKKPTTTTTTTQRTSTTQSSKKPVIVPTTIPKKPTTTKSTAPATTSSTPSTSSSTTSKVGKRGLAFNNPDYTKPFGPKSPGTSADSPSQVSWTYNWYMSPCDGFPYQSPTSCSYNQALMHIPCLWSDKSEFTSVWDQAVASALSRGVTHLFSFNEPDGPFQGSSNMPIPSAVAAYQKYMQPYAGKFRLGAPAVTNAGAPYGLTYLQKFMTACDGCTFDFVNVHWYSNKYAGANYFKSFIGQVREVAGGRPIWVTEFALNSEFPVSEAENKAFLEEVMAWMDQQPDIAGYSYFMDTAGMLMNQAGTAISPLGETFNTFTNGTVKGGPWS